MKKEDYEEQRKKLALERKQLDDWIQDYDQKIKQKNEDRHQMEKEIKRLQEEAQARELDKIDTEKDLADTKTKEDQTLDQNRQNSEQERTDDRKL